MPSQNMLIIGGALAIGAIVILAMRDGGGGFFTRFVPTPDDSELVTTPPTFLRNRGEEEQVGV